MMVDFAALAPYYFRTICERLLHDVGSSDMVRGLRIVRIFRVMPLYAHMVVSTRGFVNQAKAGNPTFMRCFKLNAVFDALRLGDYAAGAPLFFTTLKASFPAICVALIASFCMTMMFGTGMYMAERGTFMATPEYPDGAFLVRETATEADTGRQWVEGAHANVFTSMWYVVSDTTTSKCRAVLCCAVLCCAVLCCAGLGVWDACVCAHGRAWGEKHLRTFFFFGSGATADRPTDRTTPHPPLIPLPPPSQHPHPRSAESRHARPADHAR
jgi:hypothetical protein